MDLQVIHESDIYTCQECETVLEEEPSDFEKQSIGCDGCDKWFHYKCVNIKGDETFLKRKNSKWYCNICNPKGKGKGKGRKTII